MSAAVAVLVCAGLYVIVIGILMWWSSKRP